MHFRTPGIVIREQTISENDKLVTLLTQKKGVIRAFARGAKKPKSNKNAGTQQFCYCDFDIYAGNEVFVIEEAVVKETFFSIRDNIKNLALAQYFGELFYELAPREDEAEEYLKLLLNVIYMLLNSKKEAAFLKPVVEIRLLTMAGYMPRVFGCKVCGEDEGDTMYFSTATGDMYCPECNNNKYNAPISESVVAAMRHVSFVKTDKLFSFNLKGDSLKIFGEVAEQYLLHTTMRKYKTLDFYKMVE